MAPRTVISGRLRLLSWVLCAWCRVIGQSEDPGALDTTFTPPPEATIGAPGPMAVTLDDEVLLGGPSPSGSRTELLLLREDGSPAPFPPLPAPTEFLLPLPDGGWILDNGGILRRTDVRGVLQPLPSLANATGVGVLQDARFYVAGIRTRDGSPAGLVRFLPDGSDDRSFSAGAALEDFGFAGRTHILPQSDGRVVVVGSFQRAAGVSRIGFARFNSDGTLDEGYDPARALDLVNPALKGGCTVRFAGLTADGSVVAHVLRASERSPDPGFSRVVRISPDGLPDPNFQPPEGVADKIWSGAVQPDGAVILAGGFTEVAGQVRTGIARLRPDGSLDPDFNPTVTGAAPWIRLLLPDGRLLVGGEFTAINGQPVRNLARLFAYTPPQQPPVAVALRDRVKAAPGESVRLETRTGGWPRPQLQWRRAGSALPGETNRTLTLSKVAVGDAGAYVLTASNALGTVDAGVELDVADRSPLPGQVDSTATVELSRWARPRSLVPLPDGAILLGGEGFQMPGESPADPGRLLFRIRADGSPDSAFNLAQPLLNLQRVETIEPAPGGFHVGGHFEGYQNQPVAHLMRLTTDGRVDPDFAPLLGGPGDLVVHCLHRLDDGRLLVGGRFTSVNGIPAHGLAILRTDGSPDPAFTAALEPTSTVTGILPLPDGGVLVAGAAISDPNVLTRWPKLVRLNPDGTRNDSYQPADTSAQSLVAGDANRVIFTSGSRTGSVLLGGQLDVDFGTRSELSPGSLETARLLSDGSGDIYLGLGRGAQLEGVRGLKGIARLRRDGRLDPSFSPVGLPEGECLTFAGMSDGRMVMAYRTTDGTVRTRLIFLQADSDRTLREPEWAAGRLHATLATLEHRRYALERSTTGIAGAWQPVREINGDGFQQSLDAPAEDGATLFLRVRRIQ